MRGTLGGRGVRPRLLYSREGEFARGSSVKRLAVVVLGLVSAALIACGGDAERNDDGTVVSGGDESVFDLEVGDCWNTPAGSEGTLGNVEAVPCDEPHDAEVYFQYETDLAEFPGDDEMFDVAAQGCLAEFEDFVGATYDESDLDIRALYPTAGSWDDGDRVVSCSVFPLDESKITGSMEGIGPDAVEDVDPPDGGGNQSVFDLQTGDCFDDIAGDDDGEQSTVPVVDCSGPHDNEIYHEYSIDARGSYPGEDEVIAEADEVCSAEFETFVGAALADSELTYFPVYPTEESWAAGDRVVYCALYASDLSKLTGSMAGARR